MAVVLKQSPVQYVDNDSPVTSSLGHLSTVEWVGLDVETMGARPGTERYTPGLDPHLSRIRLLTLATPDTAYVFDLAHVNADGVFRWLRDHKSHLIIHNARFDLSHLQQAGVFLPNAWDTFLADRILRVGEHGSSSLAAMAERYLGETMEKELQVSDWSKELTEDQIEYAGRDALVLPRLRLALLDKLSRADIKKIAQIEFGAVPAFAMLARTGFYFDSASWTKLAVRAEKDLADITEELHQVLPGEECPPTLFGMEPKPVLLSSPAQVKAALHRIGVKVDGTSEHELLMVDHPVVSLMLRHRQVMTRLKMFLRPMPNMVHPVTGRIHAEYWQTAAASGRTASSNPNIQQIPHDNAYRSCFTAGPGRSLVIADYSQIELRIVAEECGDPKMLEAFEKGLDIHQQTAALVTGKKPEDVTKAERQTAKAVNFGLVYGMGADGLVAYARDAYGVVMSRSQAAQFRRRYFEAYPKISEWHHRQVAIAKREKCVRTLSGRIRPMPEPLLTVSANSPTQGTGADILKLALGEIARVAFPRGWDIVAEVHDEIVLEVPEGDEAAASTKLEQVMVSAGQEVLKTVPVEAEASIGKTWADK